jgi:hypothetical protein
VAGRPVDKTDCGRRFFPKSLFSAGISENFRTGPRRLAAQLAFFERGIIPQCLVHEFAGNGSILPEWLGLPR